VNAKGGEIGFQMVAVKKNLGGFDLLERERHRVFTGRENQKLRAIPRRVSRVCRFDLETGVWGYVCM